MTTLFTILFDGVAYGMLLFVLACGLAVTLGLMNFVNLAHGAFAMTGGYVCAVLVNRSGWPFFAALPLAFVASALIGAVLERSLYRHLYNRSHLDQVLFSVGLVFMSMAAVDYIMGSSRIFIKLPAALEGQIDFFGVGIGRYRLMIIVICGLLTAALQLVLARTRFGSRLRAAVDDPRAASGLGINVPQVFAFTFAFGCGLAGLGGALSAEILGLDPYFPLKFMIYFLIVVTVGGSSSITGPFLASLLLGIGDVAGKYYVPKMGPVVIYTIMIVILIWRPNALFARAAARGRRHDRASRRRISRQAARALALQRNRVLDSRARLRVPVSLALSDHDRHRAVGIVRAVARSDPGLRRHRLARSRRVLRRRRLFRRAVGVARRRHRARGRAGGCRPRRHRSWLSHQFSGDQGRRPDPSDGDTGDLALAGSAGGAVFQHHRRHRRAARHRDAADPWPVCVRHVRQGRLLLFNRRAVRAVPGGAADRALAIRPVAARDPQ